MDTNGHESLLRDASLPHAALVYSIVGAAFEVLKEIGHGLHEKPYENALVVEFGLRNLWVRKFGFHKIGRLETHHRTMRSHSSFGLWKFRMTPTFSFVMRR